MTTVKGVALALTAALGVATMTGAAEARGSYIGGGIGGGHVAHMAPMGHVGHPGHIGHLAHMSHGPVGHHHHHHHGFFPVFGLYDPGYYAYYDDEECYRIYRNHHWRTVCD